MGPFCHLGITSALLAGIRMMGFEVSPVQIAITLVGGVFIDCDKAFEIYHDKIKKTPPDITARARILHSVFAFPFAALLSCLSYSPLPFIAVLLHIVADSSIPGLKKNNRHYPPHSPWKWVMIPFAAESWYRIVPKGWPIQYPPQFNLCYKLAEPIGMVLFMFSGLIVWAIR